jgi:hypothetical protein
VTLRALAGAAVCLRGRHWMLGTIGASCCTGVVSVLFTRPTRSLNLRPTRVIESCNDFRTQGSSALTQSTSIDCSMLATRSSGVSGALAGAGLRSSSGALSTSLEASCTLASGGATLVCASSFISLRAMLSDGESCEARFRSFRLLYGSQNARKLQLAG